MLVETYDHQQVEIPNHLIDKYQSLKNIEEDLGELNEEDLPKLLHESLDKETLLQIIDLSLYFSKIEDDKESEKKFIKSGLEKLDNRIDKLPLEDLFKILNGLEYLDYDNLVDKFCERVAQKIIGHSPEEIRKVFNLEGDLTLEEKENIKNEYSWIFD